MTDKDFTTCFTVTETPEEVFAAIINPRGWWSGEFEGSTDKLNDEFVYRYQDLHVSTQQVIELVPGRKVGWLVVDANLSYAANPAEWKGTRITFDISETGDGTEVRFTHVGLAPTFDCFEMVADAWNSLVNGSLRSLITTGKGQLSALSSAETSG